MNLKTFLIIGIIGMLYSCSPKMLPKGQVNYVGFVDDQITVKSTSYSKKKSLLLREAQINAIDMIFFRGVANSTLNKPMIGPNELEIKAEHKEFFKRFYDSEYSNFVNNYEVIQGMGKANSGGYTMTIQLKINTNALKRHLVANNVIRKFGI